MEPQVKIIADSLNGATGDRITTFVLKYHRFIHSEFMTHRMFSRNASSSRAIPIEKMINKVLDEPLYPLYWGKNQKGMQAERELTEVEIIEAKKAWDIARYDAVHNAKSLLELGLHKQIVNRVLEPFSTITVIVTATEYQNFFDLRCHKDAQPEIKALADEMLFQYEANKPIRLNPGEWHLPFTDLMEYNGNKSPSLEDRIKISVGRCARVSYLNHEGKVSIPDDLKLYERLATSKPPHLSPFEHQAIAMNKSEIIGNFKGWKQYRKILETKELIEF